MGFVRVHQDRAVTAGEKTGGAHADPERSRQLPQLLGELRLGEKDDQVEGARFLRAVPKDGQYEALVRLGLDGGYRSFLEVDTIQGFQGGLLFCLERGETSGKKVDFSGGKLSPYEDSLIDPKTDGGVVHDRSGGFIALHEGDPGRDLPVVGTDYDASTQTTLAQHLFEVHIDDHV